MMIKIRGGGVCHDISSYFFCLQHIAFELDLDLV